MASCVEGERKVPAESPEAMDWQDRPGKEYSIAYRIFGPSSPDWVASSIGVHHHTTWIPFLDSQQLLVSAAAAEDDAR
jgi:hypothetical protein